MLQRPCANASPHDRRAGSDESGHTDGVTRLALTTAYIPGLDREWHRLRSAGTWWTGAERVAVARVGRAARADAPLPDVDLPEVAVEAAARLSADPHVDSAFVERLESEGLSRPAYVEILGVASRVAAVDTFLFGIGAPEQPLPGPVPGEPLLEPNPEATIDGGLVPTVGRASAPNALSAVWLETEALLDLLDVLYLSLEEMRDLSIVKELNRAQMELIAARTSHLNECFY